MRRIKSIKYLTGLAVFLLLIGAFSVLIPTAEGVPLMPGVRTHIQSEGGTVSYQAVGDEYLNYMIDTDGNLLAFGDDGDLYYADWVSESNFFGSIPPNDSIARTFSSKTNGFAVPVADGRKPSGIRARGAVISENDMKPLTTPIPSYLLEYSKERMKEHNALWKERRSNKLTRGMTSMSLEEASPDDFKRKLLVVYVDFQNLTGLPTALTPAQISDRIFKDSEVSVAHYYKTITNGVAEFSRAKETEGDANDGIIKVTLTGAHGNWRDQLDVIKTAVIIPALTAIGPSINLKDYTSSDVLLPQDLTILLIVNGYDSAALDVSKNLLNPAVIAHSGVFSDADSPPELNGVKIKEYSVIGAYHSETRMLPFTAGIPAHELGHTSFGFVDLYVMPQSNETRGIADMWSLMGMGCWGGREPGSMPTALDAYNISTMISPKASVESSANVTLTNPHEYIKLETPNPDQYFLLHPRGRIGYDLGNPLTGGAFPAGTNGGLMIYHIDESKHPDKSDTNNDWRTRPFMRIVEAHGGARHLDADGSKFLAGYDDLFTASGNTNFTDSTDPNSKIYGSGTALNTVSGVEVKLSSTDVIGAGASNGTVTVALNIKPALRITSENNASFVEGTSGTFRVTASGDTPISYSLTRHPTGVSINATGEMTIPGTTAAGDHTFTITASNGVAPNVMQVTQEFTLTIMSYGITLNPSGNKDFGSADVGYSAQTPYSVVISNDGNQATGELTIALSGTDAGSFNLSTGSIGSIAAGRTDNFTVFPNTGLAAKTSYTATVTVSGGTGITSRTFDVSFRVNPTPTHGIELSQTSDYNFASADFGYGTQAEHSVTVRNIGTQATGLLDIVLSGTNASSFTLSKTEISSIAVSGDDSFTVRPITGLEVGTYSATVTVSGGTSITSRTFDVSFIVNPTPTPFTFTSEKNATFIEGIGGTFHVTATGTATIIYSLTGTTVPAGVTIDSASGLMTIADTVSAGTYDFFTTVSDGATLTASQPFTLTIIASSTLSYDISLNPSANHDFGTVEVGYGAQTPHSVTVRNTGSQATGLLDIVLSGTNASSFTLSKAAISSIAVSGDDSFTVEPVAGLGVNTYEATVTVSGVAGMSAKTFNVNFEVISADSLPVITTTSLPEGHVEIDYSATLAATGIAPITWSISSGILPAGLSLNGGVISGIPTEEGSFNFTVKAENSFGEATQALSIVVNSKLVQKDPTFPSDKTDVENKTGLKSDDLEVKDNKVYLTKNLAEQVAKDLLKVNEVNTHILPIFEVDSISPHGLVAQVKFKVKGSDLLAALPNEINLIGMISPTTGKLFSYAGTVADYGDGRFTLQVGGAIHSGPINPDIEYDLVAFIKDGGVFDLDGLANGKIISSIFLASEKTKDQPVPADPTYPSDKDDVAKDTGLNPDDLEERDNKVYLTKRLAENIAKELLNVDRVDTHILPVFEAVVSPNGSLAEVKFTVKGKDLLALFPDEINLIGMISDTKGKLFGYTDNSAYFDNGMFTLMLGGVIYDEEIDPDVEYVLVAYIRDGGEFDLDGLPNGKIISSIFLAAEKDRKGGGGGCDAGYGYLAFALLGFAPFILKRGK